jgi:hypothetical protein
MTITENIPNFGQKIMVDVLLYTLKANFVLFTKLREPVTGWNSSYRKQYMYINNTKWYEISTYCRHFKYNNWQPL